MKFGDLLPMGRVAPHRWDECRPSIRGLDKNVDVRADQARAELIWRMMPPEARIRFHAFMCLGERTEENRQAVTAIAERILTRR